METHRDAGQNDGLVRGRQAQRELALVLVEQVELVRLLLHDLVVLLDKLLCDLSGG